MHIIVQENRVRVAEFYDTRQAHVCAKARGGFDIVHMSCMRCQADEKNEKDENVVVVLSSWQRSDHS